MKTTTKLPKRNNAASGKKAHNDYIFIKVGRVRLNSWMSEKMPVADILVSEREIVHLDNRRKDELAKLGFTAFSYIETIAKHPTEIRKDGRGAYLFVLAGRRDQLKDLDYCAVIELEEKWMGEKRVYIVKTARPIYWGRLSKIELVCVNPRS